MCEETVKDKPTGNDSVFITYSNKIHFFCIWLDNSDYLITQKNFFYKKSLSNGSKHWEEKTLKVGIIGAKYYILTVEEKQIYLIGNKTKRIFEMNQRQR